MEEARLTAQQITAIETTGPNLLVAASAGTGKTTVLARRCLYLLVTKKVPLRSVLAVTFTEAAAADMRRKIASGLRDYLKQNPNDDLQREMMLIDRAPISTLHAFCFKLVRDHFHQLRLDPGIGIIDEDEAELLKSDVGDRLLERWFARDDDARDRFLALAEAYGGRDGQSLARQVRRLHEFLQTLPNPDKWRAEAKAAYAADGGFTKLHWFEAYRSIWQRELNQCKASADDARSLVDRVGGMEKYHAHLAAIQRVIDNWLAIVGQHPDTQEWALLLASARGLKWDKAPPVSRATEQLKFAQGLIKALKDRISNRLCKDLAAQTPAEMIAGIQAAAPLVATILELQCDFESEYTNAKARRSLLDFNDLERYAYELLTNCPTAAYDVRRRFRHILVDEYQDINPLQNAILERLSGDGERKTSEMFFVGDVKQSIYGFRLAAPKLFLDKLQKYLPDVNANEVRLPLTHNFRCRREIVDGVNHIFERIASPGNGYPYGEEERLVYSADYPSSSEISEPIPIEFHLLDKAAASKEDSDAANDNDPEESEILADRGELEREAIFITQRIHAFISANTHVWNSERTACDPATYRDIVVLLRTMQNRADTIAAVLRKHGIPVYTDSTTGFFDATEVRDMIALLEVVDNAQQDVALAAVLRSPFVALSDDELAQIRVHHPVGHFHSAVWLYADSGPDTSLRQRLGEFRNLLGQWREDSTQFPLAHVVWDIYRTTSYLEYVLGLPGGEARRANLVRLHDRARQFDQFHQQGLFRFLRFLRRLRDAEHDLGAAPVLTESDDVVRIMSIHRSKGLEFPIVFVPDLAKPFNLRDCSDPLLFHQDLLLGIDQVDLDRMQRVTTLPKVVIADSKRADVLAEEQRLLYVALTRARERLILSASVNIEKAIPKWDAIGLSSETEVGSARCALDWLGPVLARHPDTAGILGTTSATPRADNSQFALNLHSSDAMRAGQSPGRVAVPVNNDTVDAMLANQAIPIPSHKITDAEAVVAAAKARLEWRYPFTAIRSVPGKISVTEWKRRFHAIDDGEPPLQLRIHRRTSRRPRFETDAEQRVSAAERGSATHAVLQRLDFKRAGTVEDIETQINGMVERGFLRQNAARAVSVDAILAFLHRPLGIRLRSSSRVQRELEVNVLLPLSEIPHTMGYPSEEFDLSERVLVRGTIDCVFWEEESAVLIDYKTDDLSPGELDSPVAEYSEQIKLYKLALRAIYGIDARESHLVFLAAMKDVSL
jgi:ATP-dependent helicase/nuclease subunit A